MFQEWEPEAADADGIRSTRMSRRVESFGRNGNEHNERTGVQNDNIQKFLHSAEAESDSASTKRLSDALNKTSAG